VRHAAGDAMDTHEEQRGRLIAARRLVSIDATPSEGAPMLDRMRDHRARLADELADEHSKNRRLRAAMQLLPERQRQAIEMGLFGGMALRKIGEEMGISESRVCQLQKRAVEHLHDAVAERPRAA